MPSWDAETLCESSAGENATKLTQSMWASRYSNQWPFLFQNSIHSPPKSVAFVMSWLLTLSLTMPSWISSCQMECSEHFPRDSISGKVPRFHVGFQMVNHELSVLLHSVHSCCRAHFAQEKEAVFKIMSNLQETIFVSFLIVADEWHWHVTVIPHC
jgi:hypothetical protein